MVSASRYSGACCPTSWQVEQIELLRDLPWVTTWFLYNWKTAPGLSDLDAYGSVDSALVKQQPMADVIANINAVTPTVPDNSITGADLPLTSGRGSAGYVAIGSDGALSVGTPAGGGGGGASSGGGSVPMGSLYRDKRGVWPPADAVNGPLLLDAGHTQTAPTGMRFIPWNSGLFNLQSQNWQAIPPGYGPATNAACENVTTDRGNNYGGPGIQFPCHIDFSFISDTSRLVLQYYVNPANYGVTTSYHETQIFAELQGEDKGIREAPAMTAHGGPGGVYYRSVTFAEARSKEFTVWLSSNCWLMGVYIDTNANLFKAPNRPLLYAIHGNSWYEGNGNVFSFFGGNGAVAGVGFSNASLLYSCVAMQIRLSTGAAVANCAQGGTQWINANASGIGRDDATTKGFTSTFSTNQVNNLWSKFGTRYPIPLAPGNYNDGDNPVAGSGATLRDNYRDVVLYGIDKVISIFTANGKPDVPIILGGGEPKLATAGSNRDLTSQGIIAAAALRPANVIGVFNFLLDWGGDVTSLLGPDTLHPLIRIAQGIGDNEANRMANFQVPQSWINNTLAAAN